jgi:hypothetical protein
MLDQTQPHNPHRPVELQAIRCIWKIFLETLSDSDWWLPTQSAGGSPSAPSARSAGCPVAKRVAGVCIPGGELPRMRQWILHEKFYENNEISLNNPKRNHE